MNASPRRSQPGEARNTRLRTIRRSPKSSTGHVTTSQEPCATSEARCADSIRSKRLELGLDVGERTSGVTEAPKPAAAEVVEAVQPLEDLLVGWLESNERARLFGGDRHKPLLHAWLKLKRYVRKGEKGIMILAPIVRRSGPKQRLDGRLPAIAR